MGQYAAESARLWLQNLTIEEHLDGFHDLMSHPESSAWSEKPAHTTIEDSIARLRDVGAPSAEKPWAQKWAILLRPESDDTENIDEDGTSQTETPKPKMIGVVTVPREAEIGYKIHPDYWGKGYMTEALALFLEMFWKTETNNAYDKLNAGADPENIGSVRTLEKAGFQKGELKKEFLERHVNKGSKKSDMQFFYLERPVK